MTRPRRFTGIPFIALLAAGCLAAGAARAQGQAAAPAAGASAAASAPDAKPDCGPKPEHPGRLGSDAQRRNWTKAANAYVECWKNFVTVKQQVAQQYMKAANDAIDQYNAIVKEFEAASRGD